MYNKYPTSFETYREFLEILGSIPEENRLEWAENLTAEQLTTKDGDIGWTVAHILAYNGILPGEYITEKLLRKKDRNNVTVAHNLAYSGTLPEKFITEESLRMKTINGSLVAGYYFNFLSKNNRWDLLTPIVLDAPYKGQILVIDKTAQSLSKKSETDLETILSLMPGETQMKLLSDIKNPDLLERIRKCLDREMENEAFETSPDGEQDLHSEERESLYCGMRSDR